MLRTSKSLTDSSSLEQKSPQESWMPSFSEKERLSLLYLLERSRKELHLFQKRLAFLEANPSYDSWTINESSSVSKRLLNGLYRAELYDYELALEYQKIFHQLTDLRLAVCDIAYSSVSKTQAEIDNTEYLVSIDFKRARFEVYKLNHFPGSFDELQASAEQLKKVKEKWESLLTQHKASLDKYPALRKTVKGYHEELSAEYEVTLARCNVNFARWMLMSNDKSQLDSNPVLQVQLKQALSFALHVYGKPSTLQITHYRSRMVEGLLQPFRLRKTVGSAKPANSTLTTLQRLMANPGVSSVIIKAVQEYAEFEHYKLNCIPLMTRFEKMPKSILAFAIGNHWIHLSKDGQIELKNKEELAHFFKNLDLETVRVVAIGDRAYPDKVKLPQHSLDSLIKLIEAAAGRPIFSACYYMADSPLDLALSQESFWSFFESGTKDKGVLFVAVDTGACAVARKAGYKAVQALGGLYSVLGEQFKLPAYKKQEEMKIELEATEILSPKAVFSPKAG